MLRRSFLQTAIAPAFLRGASLTPRERIDRALAGRDVDRTPYSFWHHFHLADPDRHARVTLEYHSKFRTDLVKVMSDFPFPQPAGAWYELKPLANPFPRQIRALGLIRDGLHDQKYFVETLFNAWNVAEKLSSPRKVRQLKKENPTALLEALSAITESECNHVHRALQAGAAGVFLSIANAKAAVLSPGDYSRFSAPFDRRILEAASGARLNVMHLHVEPGYLDLFQGFPAAVLNYSLHASRIPLAAMRRHFDSKRQSNPSGQAPALVMQWKGGRTGAGSGGWATPESRGSRA
ncbi:MAG: hypothetical protein NTY38_13360, partial [Acidobacteria bacterium]|nr:hypothetical protein [Acidobacteriota bacterium]